MTTPDVPREVRAFVEGAFAANPALPRGTWELSWAPKVDAPATHVWVWHVLGEEEVN